MRFNLAAIVLSGAALVAAKPFQFPLSNGFPSPSKAAQTKIGEHAGGVPPTSGFPTHLSKEAIQAFQLVALNEIFEVAFFSELLQNITDAKPGYKVSNKHYMMRVFRRIRAQEEFHALGANGLLAGVKAPTIGGLCKYEFPVSDFDSAVALAETFTSIVLGVVPQIQALLGKDGGQELNVIPLVGSILAQEGEQTGWFRAVQGKAPSAAPFLTGGAAQFAFTAVSMFIVPGSCDKDIKTIGLTPLSALEVTKKPTAPKNQMLSFVADGKIPKGSMLTYISGQSLPASVPIKNAKTKGGKTSFDASFPFVSGGFAKGLTIAAITQGSKSFKTPGDVGAAASHGPGLIIFQ